MNCACENQLEEIIECRGRGDMRIDKMLRRRDRLREGTCLARKGDRLRQSFDVDLSLSRQYLSLGVPKKSFSVCSAIDAVDSVVSTIVLTTDLRLAGSRMNLKAEPSART